MRQPSTPRGERSEQAIRAKFAKRTSHSGEVREADEPCGIPPPLGRAEQRSSVRIKTLALFERSEFASVPNAASSARNPKGTDVARLFFGYFFLATQKKVTRPPGRDPACHRSKVTAANQTPPSAPQGNHKGCPYTLTPHSYDLTPPSSQEHGTPCHYDLTPHPSLLTPHSSLLTPHSSLLTPHSSLLTPHSSLLTPTTSPLTPARSSSCKRKTRRCTLPVVVMGSASTNSISLGYS